VISILLEIQKEYNYLPKLALDTVARELDMFLSEIYSIATFYKAFSLKPRGKHIITVCLGTACHVRGGSKIADALSRELSIEPGETSEDRQFTLETVNCLGACALGPVIVVDEEYYGNMSVGMVEKILKRYRRG
jgi:NADH-quinone oxidoreductase subunit E